MKDYSFLGQCSGKKFCIDGIDVFSNPWITLGACDIVLEPVTKKPYSFSVYKIETSTKTIQFLAGQFANGDWAFYTEKTDDTDDSFLF